MRQLRVIEVNVAQHGGFKVFAIDEPVALQHLLDSAVETFNHSVGLGMLRRRQAVLDAEVGAEAIEVVFAGRRTFAQTEQTVGEFLAIARSEQSVR